jgi:beta-carotene 15,15'-dioxygenase
MAISFFKLRLQLILFGIILLSCSFIFFFNVNVQLYFFGITMLITGIPHGALDFFLDKENKERSCSRHNAVRFFTTYLVTMLLYTCCWFLSPVLSLVIFLFITAFHFGQIDSAILPNTVISKSISFLYGFQIILLLITCHSDETISIIQYITADAFAGKNLSYALIKIFDWCLLSIGVTLFLTLFIMCKNPSYRILGIAFVLQTIILVGFIYFLPFYLGFAFYFGIWHSFLSFDIIMKSLSHSQKDFGWKKLISKALPYTVLAWAGIVTVILICAPHYYLNELIAGVFIAISILTLPHLNVFSKTVSKSNDLPSVENCR